MLQVNWPVAEYTVHPIKYQGQFLDVHVMILIEKIHNS